MDNVSSFSIKYNFIRIPTKRTNNILSYAAEIFIKINDQCCFEDYDFAILDFALSLREWRQKIQQDYIYYPMDDDVVRIKFICEKDKYLIVLSQDEKIYQFNAENHILFTSIDKFLNLFDNDLKNHKDCLARYNYSI